MKTKASATKQEGRMSGREGRVIGEPLGLAEEVDSAVTKVKRADRVWFCQPTSAAVLGQVRGARMTEKERTTLLERLRQLGYRRNKHIKLYGEKFLLTGDPIVVDDHHAFVEAIDRKSGAAKRIAIPLPVLDVATERFG
jgi:hypothetical protein